MIIHKTNYSYLHVAIRQKTKFLIYVNPIYKFMVSVYYGFGYSVKNVGENMENILKSKKLYIFLVLLAVLGAGYYFSTPKIVDITMKDVVTQINNKDFVTAKKRFDLARHINSVATRKYIKQLSDICIKKIETNDYNSVKEIIGFIEQLSPSKDTDYAKKLVAQGKEKMKIGLYDKATKYFDIAVQKKYNLANAYIGKAGALKDLKKNDEYVATLKEGLEAVPGNKTLTKLYSNYYINAGITAQKAGKVEEAEEAYKQVLAFQGNNVNALYSLGALYFNNGATILKKATPLATSDRAKYDEEAAKADKDFKEAKTYLEKLVPLLSADKPAQKKMLDNANNLLKQVAEQLK